MNILNRRIEILKAFGAQGRNIALLLNYNDNKFNLNIKSLNNINKYDDEPFVNDWLIYRKLMDSNRVLDVLRCIFIQLNFPIEEGISKQEEYLAAVRKGILLPERIEASGVKFNYPDRIELDIYQTQAGKIPIITVNNREDFKNLIRAVSKRNEPVDIPDSFGASMFSGYNNWNRINTYKKKFLENNSEDKWPEEFSKLIPQKHLYQDKFIILSNSFYSGVDTDEIGLSEKIWKEKSLIIRKEHECTHYFTKRIFASMRNNIYDEIMADYAGVMAAFGVFKSDLFLKFLGLEKYPDYRKTGRLEIYKGELTGNAFKVLQSLIVKAAKNLEVYSMNQGQKEGISKTLIKLAKLTLEELAARGMENIKN